MSTATIAGSVPSPATEEHAAPRPHLSLVRTERVGRSRRSRRAAALDEAGATTAEYAVVTGAGVGFAGVLFKFLTSEAGQALLRLIFDAIKALLPF